MQGWVEELCGNKWPDINEEIAFREIITVRNVTEQRNVGSIAYRIRCKLETQVMRAKLEFGNEQELERIRSFRLQIAWMRLEFSEHNK
jgi:hypothetical protein